MEEARMTACPGRDENQGLWEPWERKWSNVLQEMSLMYDFYLFVIF